MTAEQIAAVAAVILSLLMSYVPGLNAWYGNLDSTVKRLIMAFLLLVVTGGALGLSCAGLDKGFECSQAGLWQAVQVFIAALVANQAAYMLTPRPSIQPLAKG